MKFMTITSIILSTLAVQAQASELDPVQSPEAPQGLVVRIGADGMREVYKADLSQGVVESEAAADAVLRKSIKEENKVESLEPASELDRVSSDESWHFAWNALSAVAGYFTYQYRCGNGNYSYYPSYSRYSGGYQYNYYYSPSHYGNRGGGRYNDSYGYHHGRSGWRGPRR